MAVNNRNYVNICQETYMVYWLACSTFISKGWVWYCRH